MGLSGSGWWLYSTIIKAFSRLDDSMILWNPSIVPELGDRAYYFGLNIQLYSHVDMKLHFLHRFMLWCAFCLFIELFELESTIKGHLVQLPCNKQGHLQLDQVAQSPVQPDLECLRGWGIHHTSGQPVPVFNHFYCIYLFLIFSINLPYFSLKSFPFVLSPKILLKSLSPSFL